MLRAGCVVISVWAGFNLALALGIVFALVVLGKNAPALTILFDAASVQHIEPRALATVNSLAVLFNACAAAFCALVLVVTWCGIRARVRWAYASVACTMSFVQLAGFASDAKLGSVDLVANVASTVLLAIGLACAGVGMRARVSNDSQRG